MVLIILNLFISLRFLKFTKFFYICGICANYYFTYPPIVHFYFMILVDTEEQDLFYSKATEHIIKAPFFKYG